MDWFLPVVTIRTCRQPFDVRIGRKPDASCGCMAVDQWGRVAALHTWKRNQT